MEAQVQKNIDESLGTEKLKFKDWYFADALLSFNWREVKGNNGGQ